MFLRRKHTQKDDSEQRDAKVSELRAAIGPLSGRSSKYCTDACLRRYLEARNWNVDKAKKMLEETLKWRSTYKPEEIRWHEVAHEGETGKVSRASFHDRQGRTVLIMRPGMQSHYPERLAIGFLYNPPRIFEAFYKAIRYFLDPKTAQKVKFVYPKNKDSVELMKSYFDVENLPSEFGGKATLKYDHEEFSRLMAQDDVKTAKFWGIDDKPYPIANVHSAAEVAPEPAAMAQRAS
ncbi:CRAL-TRIO domain-containing protein C23B6.04c-like isoform X2 [Durio zibethinus]|uniref:CRAL-TRIO domain-containing protein C23B6.04c-like isoform X2 n=1 Tax=Durio zibethinus TaxID=66656 RepID=A0A6P5ZGZ0_DURZI|nr:CRAL-TRIO domain-containing protein C23B6.04c-like isoform X2 [Durio zibethinus]